MVLWYNQSGLQVSVTTMPTRCLQLYDAIQVCIASGRGTQLLSLAQSVTLPQQWRGVSDQSSGIALHARLADKTGTRGKIKSQRMALRKLEMTRLRNWPLTLTTSPQKTNPHM